MLPSGAMIAQPIVKPNPHFNPWTEHAKHKASIAAMPANATIAAADRVEEDETFKRHNDVLMQELRKVQQSLRANDSYIQNKEEQYNFYVAQESLREAQLDYRNKKDSIELARSNRNLKQRRERVHNLKRELALTESKWKRAKELKEWEIKTQIDLRDVIMSMAEDTRAAASLAKLEKTDQDQIDVAKTEKAKGYSVLSATQENQLLQRIAYHQQQKERLKVEYERKALYKKQVEDALAKEATERERIFGQDFLPEVLEKSPAEIMQADGLISPEQLAAQKQRAEKSFEAAHLAYRRQPNSPAAQKKFQKAKAILKSFGLPVPGRTLNVHAHHGHDVFADELDHWDDEEMLQGYANAGRGRM